jgi:RNA recognition motif-containing protein
MSVIAVEHLTLNVDSEHLHELFSTFGPVSRAQVSTDRTTGLSKGLGFVEFQDSNDALTSLIFMNHGFLDGNTLSVSLVHYPKDL